MTPAHVGVVVAVLVAGALAAFGRAVSVQPWSVGGSGTRGVVGSAGSPATSTSSSAGLSAERTGARWVAGFVGDGLSLTGLAPDAIVGRAITAAMVAGLASMMSVGALAALGGGAPAVVSMAVIVLATAAAGWTMVADARSKARRAHADLRRATNDLVQLVAIGLTTDQSVEEALRFALETAASDGSAGSELLRTEIVAAPLRGEPVWEAIDRIGRLHGVRELSEFANSLERQATHGVSIGATVAALAAVMRARALDHLEREADRANANLAGPTAGFVVATLVFLAYPLAVRISEAFGG